MAQIVETYNAEDRALSNALRDAPDRFEAAAETIRDREAQQGSADSLATEPFSWSAFDQCLVTMRDADCSREAYRSAITSAASALRERSFEAIEALRRASRDSRRHAEVIAREYHDATARAVAQERVTRSPDGLVRIGLKKAFSDGTVAVDMDPLSLLSRLCASVPPAALSHGRCEGRLRLVAMATEPNDVARSVRALGEPTEAPARAPARGTPYWKSRALRRATDGHEAAE